MSPVVTRLLSTFIVVAATATLLACGIGSNSISGEVRFVRDVDLPANAVVIVTLQDVSHADASAIELGRDTIVDVQRLPVSFRIEYDRADVEGRNEYSLSARVEVDGQLIYTNDTTHPVLTQGAPDHSDVTVVSTDPFDQCVEPLPGQIHSANGEGDLPDDAILEIQLWDISEPGERVLVVEASFRNLGAFPIDFELPHEGVEISRHHLYELEANISFDGELQYHILNAEWRRTILPHCPNDDLLIVKSVFPVSELPAE